MFCTSLMHDAPPIIAADPDQPCFIQYTSGSTGAPKAVVVTHRNVIAAARICANAAQQPGHGSDVVVSWLPLYHDLGLIGFFIAPLLARVPMTLLAPGLFARRPRMWIEALHRSRATITGAPPFAFSLVVRRLRPNDLDGLDLSSLRVLLCGAEPIQMESFHAFAEALRPTGFDPDTFMPCYGLAEATLAVSIRKREEPIRADRLSAEQLRNGLVAAAAPTEKVTTIVSCGRPVEGHIVEIAGPDGDSLGSAAIGEIRVKGPSVTLGAARHGWLHTGDLGYMREGELYVCGRLKDVIIVRGANFHPHEFEATATSLVATRGRLAAAFPVDADGTETFVLALETPASATGDAADLVKAVTEAITREHGVTPVEVVLVAPGTICVTTSGKVQRRRMRDLYETGALHSAAPRTRSARLPDEAPIAFPPDVVRATGNDLAQHTAF
jgi:fatty-acyl-CoA synthase